MKKEYADRPSLADYLPAATLCGSMWYCNLAYEASLGAIPSLADSDEGLGLTQGFRV